MRRTIKRGWKILLLALLLALLTQMPFIYRRYRLGRLHAAILLLNNSRRVEQDAQGLVDYKGVMHVHTSLGGHSSGQPAEVVQAAKANALDFVLMTEHPSEYLNTAAATLQGVHERVLFLNGNEINTNGSDRLLIAPGLVEPPTPDTSAAATQSVVSQAKADGRLVIVAYPEQWRDWNVTGFDGVEVYNLYTNSKRINYALLLFDGLWSYRSYPELLWTNFYEAPAENLKKWDELNASGSRRIVATAGSDAHANVGLHLQDAAGHKLFGIQLDPYERSFRIVRTHVLLAPNETLNSATLLGALSNGHCYIAFDVLCDASGFRFTAENEAERKTMGDDIALGASGVRLRALTPVKSRMQLLKDGQVWQEESAKQTNEWFVRERGVYRVEVFLEDLPPPLNSKPWIISNPIYVK